MDFESTELKMKWMKEKEENGQVQARVPVCSGRRSWRRGAVMTKRDGELIGWIGRQRFASAGQVRERFGLSRSKAYERLRGRCTDGLLIRHAVLHGHPSVYSATRAGLLLARVDLPVASATAQGFVHDLTVTSVVCQLELAGHVVLTEREFQRAERRGAGTFSISVSAMSSSGASSLHRPDCIVTGGERPWAVEVELTAKSPERLTAILRAYRRAVHLAGVHYIVPHQRDADRVRQVGESLQIAERLRISTLGDCW